MESWDFGNDDGCPSSVIDVDDPAYNPEFDNSDWSGKDLTGDNLSNAPMAGFDLTNAVLIDANLTNACLNDADLTGADLTGARLAYLNPSYGPADISGVTWTNAICPDGTHASTVGNTCANNL